MFDFGELLQLQPTTFMNIENIIKFNKLNRYSIVPQNVLRKMALKSPLPERGGGQNFSD